MDDFRRIFYIIIVGFFLTIFLWVGFIMLTGCGWTLSCAAAQPTPQRTSIPTLIPGTMPAVNRLLGVAAPAGAAGTPASGTQEAGNVPRPSNPGGPGKAVDLTGDVASGQQIFTANCAVCHGADGKGGNPNPGATAGTIPALNPIDPHLTDPDPKTFTTNIDLFIEHGSTPAGPGPTFTMPAWGDKALLQPQQIADVIAYVKSLNPVSGAPSAPSTQVAGAASPTAAAAASPAPTASGAGAAGTPTEEASGVPRPTNPGGPGPALGLTGSASSGQQVFAANCAVCHGTEGRGGNPNLGTTDGTIPPLNPIDPLLKDPDPKVFAHNIDLFIEHGSTPDGPGPTFTMPPWGDRQLLTPQQIADVIAYVLSLNP
jgi:mono/diheme cytochrome c family protein